MKKQKSKSGYESEVTVYECEDCIGYPYKENTSHGLLYIMIITHSR